MTQEQKLKYMTETPVPKLVSKLAIPTIISMLITSFYNMADTFFVGKLNDPSATAAVGVVFSYMAIIQAIGFMFGHGSGNYISRKLGEKDIENASIMASDGFFFALLFGTLLMILGLVFMTPLSYMLGSTETILPYTKDYLRYILLASPYMTSALVLNNQLRFQGSALYAMIGIVSGAVLNIGLDPFLMFVVGLGFKGAAIATAVSQLVSFILLWVGTHKSANLRIRFRNIRVKGWVFVEILRGGVPSLCRQGLASIAAICLNLVAGGLGGDTAIAGMSIVSRIMMFANSAMIGFGQGMQPVCGFNYGAKKYDRVRQSFWFCVRWAVMALAVIGAVGFIFSRQLTALFQNNQDVLTVAGWALKFQCVTFIFNAWIVPSNMMLQSVGRAVSATLLAAARQGLMFLPALYLLSHFFGITGVELAQPVADFASFLLAIPLTVHFLRQTKAAERLENQKNA